MDEINDETRWQIFGFWAKGIGPRSIARTFGLTPAVVDEVVDAEKQNEPNPFDQDPVDVIRDHFIRLDSLREDVASLISREKDGSVRARALSLQLQLNVHRLELSQAIGTLPPPEKFRTWVDGIALANRMLALLDRAGVLNAEILDAIVAEFPSTRKLPASVDESS